MIVTKTSYIELTLSSRQMEQPTEIFELLEGKE